MVFEGIKNFFRSVGGEKKPLLVIEQHPDGWFIMDGTEIFAGPYVSLGAAKGQRTRYLKGYSAASRRPA